MNNYCNSITSNYDFINEYRSNGLLGCFDLNINDNTKLDFISNILLDNNRF